MIVSQKNVNLFIGLESNSMTFQYWHIYIIGYFCVTTVIRYKILKG
jgi:hypothetical protein